MVKSENDISEQAASHNPAEDLDRFVRAQEPVYKTALSELKNGRKRTHWMWYIFPQVEGLVYSETSKFYAIHGFNEAQRYLDHPLLGARLRECAETVLAVERRSAREIFGEPDDSKLKSSMTLFEQADITINSVFARVLDKYFSGQRDVITLRKLESLGE